jgi:L-rhamnose mutarotase
MEYTGMDYARDMAALAQDKTTRDWWRLTAPCQQPVPTAEESRWWAPAEESSNLNEAGISDLARRPDVWAAISTSSAGRGSA